MGALSARDEIALAAGWLAKGSDCGSTMAYHACSQAARHLDQAAEIAPGLLRVRCIALAAHCRTAGQADGYPRIHEALAAVSAFQIEIGA